MKVDFYRHNLDQDDIAACVAVLNSLFLTTGAQVKDFEQKFADYLNAPFAVGVSSCTDALFLSLKACGVGPGDEVITTPMSFISTANVIEHCGATPVFVDVEPDTGNIDANRMEAAITPKTKVIMPVHLYGQMCDMRRIRTVADRHQLKVIEDAAHCVEGWRDGLQVGELADLTCFSFYATKNLACGEGGAVACRDEVLYEFLLRARLHGMSKSAADRYTRKYEHYDMEFLGYKMNMSNIQASLLINQLAKLEERLVRKEEIAHRYDKGFSRNTALAVPSVRPDSKHARHLYTIWVDPQKRDEYMHQLQEAGVGVAVNFRAIHLMQYYREKYGYQSGCYPCAESIGASTITLPFYPRLSDDEVNYVVEAVTRVVRS